MKELCEERPYRAPRYFPWNEDTKKLFKLDTFEVSLLEDDKVVWKETELHSEPTALSLEESDGTIAQWFHEIVENKVE
jgi:hypothetical protein